MDNATRQAAMDYNDRGWAPIPLRARSKEPSVKWKNFTISDNGYGAFVPEGNIGVRLGQASNGLVDIDLDWSEASIIAGQILRDLPCFGRPSSPHSHYLFKVQGDMKSSKFALPASLKGLPGLPDEHALCVAEIRGEGAQTMFPPSMHPSGEMVAWVGDLKQPPILSSEKAMKVVGLIAFLAVCLRFYPVSGTRDDFHMALAGALLRAKHPVDDVNQISVTLAKFAGDEEASTRGKGERTSTQLAEGKEVTGCPRLVEMLGLPKECVDVFHAWLGVDGMSVDGKQGLQKGEFIVELQSPYGWAKSFHEGVMPNLKFYAGEFYNFDGQKYVGYEDAAIRKHFYEFLSRCYYWRKDELVRLGSSKTNADKLEDALRSYCVIEQSQAVPYWQGEGPFESRDSLVCRNMIVHISSGLTSPLTPELFSLNALDYDYQPDATAPEEWLKFLASVWPEPENRDSIDTLQEIMGYLLTQQTDQQKMFFLAGAPRAGKGVILSTITGLIGEKNVIGMSLDTMSGQFGLQNMHGKQVAMFSDVRFSGKTDVVNVVEKLLNISGEDSITVQRKFLTSIHLRLNIRMVFAANEIPMFNDASTALVNRFVFLNLPHSYLGKEDLGLKARIKKEFPQILKWAMEGYQRLESRGYFVQPASGREKHQMMERLASPLKAFIEDYCEVGVEFKETTAKLFERYKLWAIENNINYALTPALFGNKLSSTVTSIRRSELVAEGKRVPHYVGIRLKLVQVEGTQEELPF